MPYLNKRNRFVAAAKQYAETNKFPHFHFTKDQLTQVAQSINMKGCPTWVLKDHRSAVSQGIYDLTSLIKPVTV
jgi:hypothetical protein